MQLRLAAAVAFVVPTVAWAQSGPTWMFWGASQNTTVPVSNANPLPVTPIGTGMFVVHTSNNPGAVATIDFAGLGAYPYYKMKCTSITPATGTPALQLLVHTDGAWQSANYQYSFFFYTAAGGSGNNGSTSASAINMDAGTAGDGASFDLETDDVNTTGHSKFIRGSLSGSSYGYTFQGSYQGAGNPVDGLRIQYAAGDIAAGSICTLYGMPL